ncbi:MAG: hypothetical protein PHG82_00525 [Candidatus Gracilibacteria bacterium]|nr:hypothetical protein [Candidatus Gracilibacteria bacterium]
MNQSEYDAIKEESNMLQANKIMNEQGQASIDKFKNLDSFMEEAKEVVLFYFQNQTKFNNLDDFKLFIIDGIKKYVEYINFKGNREALKKLEIELDNFDETYDKIIYFGRFNPVEARREEERAELPSLSDTLTGKTKGVIEKLLVKK